MLQLELEYQRAISRLRPTDRSIILTMMDYAFSFYSPLIFKSKASHHQMSLAANVSTKTIARHIEGMDIIEKYRKRGKGNPTIHLVNLTPIMPKFGIPAHLCPPQEFVHLNGEVQWNQIHREITRFFVHLYGVDQLNQWISGISGQNQKKDPKPVHSSTQLIDFTDASIISRQVPIPNVHLSDEGQLNQLHERISGHLARARGMSLYFKSSLPDPKRDLKQEYRDLTPNAVPEPCQFFHDAVLCEHMRAACRRLQNVVSPRSAVIPNANLHHFIHHHSVKEAVMIAMYLTQHNHSPGYIVNGAFNPKEAVKWLDIARQEIPLGEFRNPSQPKPPPHAVSHDEPRPAYHRPFDDSDQQRRDEERNANVARLAREEQERKRAEQLHCGHDYAIPIDGGYWFCRACDKTFTPDEAHIFGLEESR